MKESTIENNINKSLNALKINELGYAKEYVNRILVEVPDQALATQIRKYVEILKNKSSRKEEDKIKFLISTLKEPKANEMFPLIEFLCNEIEQYIGTYHLNSEYIQKLITEIEVSMLKNQVLNDFYEKIKTALPQRQAKEEQEKKKLDEDLKKYDRSERLKKLWKVLGILAVAAIVTLVMLSINKVI